MVRKFKHISPRMSIALWSRKPLTECNIVFFSNVSSGHANVQHVVVGGVLTTSRVHVWRIVFCLPHHGTDRMVCSHATAPQHTEQPVGDVHAFLLGYQSADVRAWFAPESNSQLSVIAPGRVLRHPRTRMLSSSVSPCHTQRNSVSEIGLHGEPRCFLFSQ